MNKKQAILIGIVALIIVLFVGLLYSFIEIETETGEDDESNKIVIIVTIAPQKEFVERVGGDKVKVAVMVPAGANLHTYEPTSSQLREVARSRIYAEVGSGVEFEIAWMEKLMSNNKDMLIVNCSNGIEKMGGDPHIWTSPVNARIMVENICDGLIRIDPDNEDYYLGNKNDYQSELDALDEYIRFKTGGFKDKVFMNIVQIL